VQQFTTNLSSTRKTLTMKKILTLFAILLAVNVFSQDDPFKGRSTEVSSDVAQAKENTPVKKESFKDKLSRISSDGNKVGVFINLGSVYVKAYKANRQTQPTMMEAKANKQDAGVTGELPAIDGLAEFGPWMVSQLNETFGTDVFELIDYSMIPVTEIKFLGAMQKVDDWWSTKYKIVVNYKMNAYYEAYTEVKATTDDRYFYGSFAFNSNLYILEYFIGKKGGTQKYIVSGKQMGSYKSEKYQGEKDTEVGTIEELSELVARKSDAEIVDMLKAERGPKLENALKKLLK